MIDPAHPSKSSLNPIVMMGLVMLAAMLLTYVVGSGRFDRNGHVVIAGTYKTLPKVEGLEALFRPGIPKPAPNAPTAYAASAISLLASVPEGFIQNSELIASLLLAGGLLGTLRRTGAIDAGIDRLIHITAGNKFILVPVIMIVLGLGSTFLGTIDEYVVLIPIVAVIGERLGYGRIFAMATVGVAAKIGYLTSVTNPYALVVAQSLNHLPLFSGAEYRLALFAIFMVIGIGYVLYFVRPIRPPVSAASHETAPLSPRHRLVLLTLMGAGLLMVIGFTIWHWSLMELMTYYVFVSLAFAAVGGVSANTAAEAYLEGLKSLFLAAFLVGLAGSVQILLQNSFILDTLIFDTTQVLHGLPAAVNANGMMCLVMALGVLIPSTTGKVAMSMPILVPIAQLSGVSGQTTVLAFILGNGLTNIVSPTVSMLLAYLAAAKVSFGEWIRFVAPLFGALLLLSILALIMAVGFGY